MKRPILKVGAGIAMLLFSCVLVFNSCKKDTSDYVTPGQKWDNSERTTATFVGQVVKEDGSPLDGATVSTGTHSILTDADGYFYFSKINTPKSATLIKVEKLGYFKAFRTITVIPNADNHSRIMVMELPPAQSLNGQTGGTIAITNGGSINFPANAIIDPATNSPYNGNVTVFAKWIDPTDPSLSLLFPGDLRGLNTEGAEEGLTTYGMQAVELVGTSGQKLQLASGKSAEVTFPLPASLASVAPGTIPLWHFNETTGMWEQDGEATKTANGYVGLVSHFSFWNCDYGGPIVNFTCQLVDANNNPVSGAIVKIIPTSSTLTARTAMTNSNGTVSGGLPVNATFNLEYIPSGCNYYSPSTFLQTFSSTTTNINLGSITVSNTSSTSTVTGTVQDCNNFTLVNTPVKLVVGNAVLTTVTNATGAFSFTVNCITSSTPAVITAYDPTNSVNGSTNVTIAPNATVNAGTMLACGAQNDFITIQVTNPPSVTPTTYSIVEPSGSFSQYFQLNTGISGSDNSNPLNPLFISFAFDGPQTVAGTHNLANYYDSNDSTVSYTPAIVNLTNYGAIGGIIAGSFNTTVTGPLFYNGATVNCTFRVTRQQ